MTGRDLEDLKSLPVPPARDEAKRAAIEAALKAFDATQGERTEAAKENVVPLRQTETSRTKRSFLMRFSTPHGMTLAASLAALLVAAPLAFRHFERAQLQIFSKVKDELASAAGGGGSSHAPATAPPAPASRPAPVENMAGSAAQPGDAVARQESGTAASDGPKAAMGIEKDSASAAPAKVTAEIQPAPATTAIAPPSRPPPAPALPDANGARQTDESVSIAGLNAPADAKAKGPAAKQPAAVPGVQSQAGAARTSISRDREPAAAGYAGTISRGDIANLNAVTGRRMIDSEKYAAGRDLTQPHDPHAWMGRADEQKAIVLEENRDKFEAKEQSPVKQVNAEPVSTFSIDVDTASYTFARRTLNAGRLPPKDAVRVEEMINYFPYAYPAPESAGTPFKPTVTVMPSPWNANNKLVHVAIKGYDLKPAERPRANIVLLMDVSGSMAPQDRLPLVKSAFRMLIDQLRPDDTVGIVTYASGSGIALEPTRVADKSKIIQAIDRLNAGGSTAGAQGIQDAYRLAEAGFDTAAVNRIILATDGDFNVGITDQNELKSYIERKRQSGIFLSILGVGQGNHNDALMQTLAQNGNGTAAYVDTLNEARKVLVDESSSTLFTIAKDVKVQIEWNPAQVAEYRLIGYETRSLKREDFNNDKVDAGDIGSGHTVTAIYEVTPVGAPQLVDDMRYGKKVSAAEPARRERADGDANTAELGFLKLRYKRPNEDVSQLVALPIAASGEKTWSDGIPQEQRFSVAVAAFGQLLKGSPYTQGYTYDDVLALAQSARGDDPFGYRTEFLNLVRLAKSARP